MQLPHLIKLDQLCDLLGDSPSLTLKMDKVEIQKTAVRKTDQPAGKEMDGIIHTHAFFGQHHSFRSGIKHNVIKLPLFIQDTECNLHKKQQDNNIYSIRKLCVCMCVCVYSRLFLNYMLVVASSKTNPPKTRSI